MFWFVEGELSFDRVKGSNGKMRIMRFVIVCTVLFALAGCKISKECDGMIPKIETRNSLVDLFPRTAREIERRVEDAVCSVERGVDALVNKQSHKRSYRDTVIAFDAINGLMAVVAEVLSVLHMTSPDEEIRNAARKGLLRIQEVQVDLVINNRAVYKALKDYAEGNAHTEWLTDERRYCLSEIIRDFERNGLNLPDDKLAEVKRLKKELAQVEVQFSENIDHDLRSCAFTREELAGLDEAFLEGLPTDSQGRYLVSTGVATYIPVINYCTVAATRETLWVERCKIAYPSNEAVLEQLIALRDKLARLLGFESYAALSLDSEMAKTPERATNFLEELRVKASTKVAGELRLLKQELPTGVALHDGLLNPWDLNFVKESYKKVHFALDNQLLREYFPVQRTFDELLSIYEHFLGLEFRQEAIDGLWHKDVKYCAVYTKNGQFVGHLLLDLYPRDHKYTHFCMCQLVSGQKNERGETTPAVALVIANFPKPVGDRPGLMSLQDVETFFHEFGHAMHGLIGKAELASFSGTNVKRDFVETPSQMFEEWISNPTVLKRISSHYKTGEPLDDATIEKICAVKHFDTGLFVQRQAALSQLALELFGVGEKKDCKAIERRIRETFAFGVRHDGRDNFPASFGHLAGYGARYYSYMWSKVFALDLFKAVKTEGLFDPEVGIRLGRTVLAGGAQEPDLLMRQFLGREPAVDAFFEELESSCAV